jgi:hypothetical protein
MTYSTDLAIFTDKSGRNASKTQFPNVCVGMRDKVLT